MKINKKQQDINTIKAEKTLFTAISLLESAAEAASFFQDLCTPAEIQAMSDRFRVVAAIKAGKPYRQIYEETGVSVTTVGRVARSLSLGQGGYELILTRLEKTSDDT